MERLIQSIIILLVKSNQERGGGLIYFLSLKRELLSEGRGVIFERWGLIGDLC